MAKSSSSVLVNMFVYKTSRRASTGLKLIMPMFSQVQYLRNTDVCFGQNYEHVCSARSLINAIRK